jgi:hypothetical protein
MLMKSAFSRHLQGIHHSLSHLVFQMFSTIAGNIATVSQTQRDPILESELLGTAWHQDFQTAQDRELYTGFKGRLP